MNTYQKINTIFKRDMNKSRHHIIEGDYSKPEFEYLKNNEWVATEKVDGTNIRIIFDGDTIQFKGKTDNAQFFSGILDKLNKLFDIELLKEVFPNLKESNSIVCLYGEMYGGCIQKGRKYRDDLDFILFDIKIGNFWLIRDSVEEIANILKISIIPVLITSIIDVAISIVKKGFQSTLNSNETAERLILFPKIQLFNRKGDRIITKIKHKDFEL